MRPDAGARSSEPGGVAMKDQRVAGTISKGRGQVEEAIGKVTGDRQTEAKGKVRQAQGTAQQAVGNVLNTVHKDTVAKV